MYREITIHKTHINYETIEEAREESEKLEEELITMRDSFLKSISELKEAVETASSVGKHLASESLNEPKSILKKYILKA